MIWRSIVLAILLLPIGLSAHGGNPPPTLVNLPCRDEQLVSLVEYYTAKSVGQQLHTESHAQLSRFGHVKGSRFACIARVDISYKDDWDIGWVEYSLPKSNPFAVSLAFRFAREHGEYTLPTDEDPQVLGASLLSEMQAAQPKRKQPANTAGPSLPIVEYEILSEARQRLIAAGWRPKKTVDSADAGASESDFIVAGYSEVDSCAVDWSYCNFNYVDPKGVCLTVTSEGEKPKSAFVAGWRFGCTAPQRNKAR